MDGDVVCHLPLRSRVMADATANRAERVRADLKNIIFADVIALVDRLDDVDNKRG